MRSSVQPRWGFAVLVLACIFSVGAAAQVSPVPTTRMPATRIEAGPKGPRVAPPPRRAIARRSLLPLRTGFRAQVLASAGAL